MEIEIHVKSTKPNLLIDSKQVFTNENKAIAYLRRLKKMSEASDEGGYTDKKMIVTIKTKTNKTKC